MTVVETVSGGRTFLQATTKLIREIGEQPISTLLQPTVRIKNAMSAVEDARDEVFYRTMWKWRRAMFRVELVASQMWYELPEDYHKLASQISRNNRDEQIKYLDYGDLLALYPEMRGFPPGSGVSTIPTVSQFIAQAENFGTPRFCTDWNGYIGFMPVPDAEFVALEGFIYGHYWKEAPALTADNDDIGLPRELWEAHNHLALSRLKKVLEYSDWADDRQVGLRMLSERASGKGDPMDSDTEYKNTVNYNE